MTAVRLDRRAKRVADGGARVLDLEAEAFAAALEEVQPLLHRLELQAAQLGLAIAPLYLASARGSLRHALECLLHQRGNGGLEVLMADELCPGTSLRLMPIEGRAGVGERFRVVGRSATPACGAEIPNWARLPDLAADLFCSREAVALCSGPVGAGLLFDALARHHWLHCTSGTKWATDVSGAHALVLGLTGGAGFPHPNRGATGGLIDREVADLLGCLGWVRMLSPRILGDKT